MVVEERNFKIEKFQITVSIKGQAGPTSPHAFYFVK